MQIADEQPSSLGQQQLRAKEIKKQLPDAIQDSRVQSPVINNTLFDSHSDTPVKHLQDLGQGTTSVASVPSLSSRPQLYPSQPQAASTSSPSRWEKSWIVFTFVLILLGVCLCFTGYGAFFIGFPIAMKIAGLLTIKSIGLSSYIVEIASMVLGSVLLLSVVLSRIIKMRFTSMRESPQFMDDKYLIETYFITNQQYQNIRAGNTNLLERLENSLTTCEPSYLPWRYFLLARIYETGITDSANGYSHKAKMYSRKAQIQKYCDRLDQAQKRLFQAATMGDKEASELLKQIVDSSFQGALLPKFYPQLRSQLSALYQERALSCERNLKLTEFAYVNMWCLHICCYWFKAAWYGNHLDDGIIQTLQSYADRVGPKVAHLQIALLYANPWLKIRNLENALDHLEKAKIEEIELNVYEWHLYTELCLYLGQAFEPDLCTRRRAIDFYKKIPVGSSFYKKMQMRIHWLEGQQEQEPSFPNGSDVSQAHSQALREQIDQLKACHTDNKKKNEKNEENDMQAVQELIKRTSESVEQVRIAIRDKEKNFSDSSKPSQNKRGTLWGEVISSGLNEVGQVISGWSKKLSTSLAESSQAESETPEKQVPKQVESSMNPNSAVPAHETGSAEQNLVPKSEETWSSAITSLIAVANPPIEKTSTSSPNPSQDASKSLPRTPQEFYQCTSVDEVKKGLEAQHKILMDNLPRYVRGIQAMLRSYAAALANNPLNKEYFLEQLKEEQTFLKKIITRLFHQTSWIFHPDKSNRYQDKKVRQMVEEIAGSLFQGISGLESQCTQELDDFHKALQKEFEETQRIEKSDEIKYFSMEEMRILREICLCRWDKKDADLREIRAEVDKLQEGRRETKTQLRDLQDTVDLMRKDQSEETKTQLWDLQSRVDLMQAHQRGETKTQLQDLQSRVDLMQKDRKETKVQLQDLQEQMDFVKQGLECLRRNNQSVTDADELYEKDSFEEEQQEDCFVEEKDDAEMMPGDIFFMGKDATVSGSCANTQKPGLVEEALLKYNFFKESNRTVASQSALEHCDLSCDAIHGNQAIIEYIAP